MDRHGGDIFECLRHLFRPAVVVSEIPLHEHRNAHQPDGRGDSDRRWLEERREMGSCGMVLEGMDIEPVGPALGQRAAPADRPIAPRLASILARL